MRSYPSIKSNICYHDFPIGWLLPIITQDASVSLTIIRWFYLVRFILQSFLFELQLCERKLGLKRLGVFQILSPWPRARSTKYMLSALFRLMSMHQWETFILMMLLTEVVGTYFLDFKFPRRLLSDIFLWSLISSHFSSIFRSSVRMAIAKALTKSSISFLVQSSLLPFRNQHIIVKFKILL